MNNKYIGSNKFLNRLNLELKKKIFHKNLIFVFQTKLVRI